MGGVWGVCVFKGGCLLYLHRGSAVHISNSVFFGTDFSLSVCAACICESRQPVTCESKGARSSPGQMVSLLCAGVR